MPKVSVLMSIYKPDERYLVEQLETIDSQDFDDFELVVYNDYPEGGSWEDFCRAHFTGHPLRYQDGEHNLGYVRAFETLVRLAEGTYIALCDQDDRWLSTRLSEGVRLLDEGHVLVSCDHQIIDGEGRVTVESWQASHPDDESVTWRTGDDITARAAFTCYSLGMAMMLRTDVARELQPYPRCTGHDKWLVLGASALGTCAKIETPLVQYRQHGANQTGALRNIHSKDDWFQRRTLRTWELVSVFAQRFPDSPALPEMQAFALARCKRDVRGIWKYRHLAPQVARLEAALCFTPDFAFRAALAARNRRGRG